MLHFSRVHGNGSESASSLLQMHPTNHHQEQQDFKCLNFANPDSPQRNGLPFSWSRLVQAAAVPFVCSDGPAKLRYFLIHRDVFMLCGPRHPVRWKHTLRLRLLCLSLGHEHSVIPKALFFTQRTESGGTWEPSSLPLASLSTGQRVQVPKVFVLTQTGMKLAAVWGGGEPSPSKTLAPSKANQCRVPLRTLRCR